MKKVTVKVPATTANLGPGFDCVGCAFTMYDTISFSLEGNGLTIIGDDPKYSNEHNLVVRGYKSVLADLGLPMDDLTVTVDYGIPMSHGLGSSAAMIVAGAVAANALHGNPLDKDGLLRVCNPIEGHPDNLAPAIYGGMTASLVKDDIPLTVKYDPHPSIHFTALIPDFNLSTRLARSVLPDQVPRQDALFNISRLAVLLKALELGDGSAIRAALDDKLHHPYRSGLIESYDELRELALECGCDGFCISGAGPTLLCLSTDESFFGRMAEAVKAFPRWQAAKLEIDRQGAVLL